MIARIATSFLIVLGTLVLAGVAYIWFGSRPVLADMQIRYAALPVSAQCESDADAPPGYPTEITRDSTLHAAELAVYHDSCYRTGHELACGHISAEAAGFRLFRKAYVSDCAVRALNLHGRTPLASAMAH